MATVIDLMGGLEKEAEKVANQPADNVTPLINLKPPARRPNVTPADTGKQISLTTGAALPGTTEAEDFSKFGPRPELLPHPATQRVLDNLELTKDMDPTEEDKFKAIAQAAKIPVELARNIHPSMIKNWMERQDTQMYLEQANATRKRMDIDIEAALVLQGSIKPLAASEQAIARLGHQILLPFKNPMQPLSQTQTEEERSVAEGFGRAILQSLVTFGKAIPLENRREHVLNNIRDADRTFGEVVGDWYDRTKPGFATDLPHLPTPGEVWDLSSRLVRWMTNSPEDKEAHTKEAIDISRQLVKIYERTRGKSSRYAQNFWDRIQALDPEMSETDKAYAMYGIVLDMPGETTAAMTEVVLQQSVPLVGSSVVRFVTRNPAAGMLVSLGGGYVQERFNDYNADVIKKYGKSADLRTEAGMKAFINSPERQDHVRGIGEDRAIAILLASLFGFKIAQTRLTKGVMTNLSLQLPAQALVEAGGEALAQVSSGQGFDSIETILEGLGGGVTAPIDIYIAGSQKRQEVQDAKAAKAWLETGKEITTQFNDIEPHALATAAEVMADRLRDEGVTTVFVSAEQLHKFDQDLPTGETATETLGLDAETVRQAAEDGRDVEIGADAYVRHILGKEGFAALVKHTRFTLEGMTPDEATEFDATGELSVEEQLTSAVQERLEKSLGVTVEESLVLREDAEAIATEVRNQLESIAGMTSREADLNSLLTARRYVARAARATKATGQEVRALDLYLEDNLTITDQQVEQVAPDAPVVLTAGAVFTPTDDSGLVGHTVTEADGTSTRTIRLIEPKEAIPRSEFDSDEAFEKFEALRADINAQRERGMATLKKLRSAQEVAVEQGSLQQTVINLDDVRQLKELKEFHGEIMDRVAEGTAAMAERVAEVEWAVEVGDKVATDDTAAKGLLPWTVIGKTIKKRGLSPDADPANGDFTQIDDVPYVFVENADGDRTMLPAWALTKQFKGPQSLDQDSGSRRAPDGLAEILKQQIKDNPEGFTMSLDGTDTPVSGFAFAPLKQTEIVLDTNDISDEIIEQLVDSIEAMMQSTDRDVFAGGWFDDGKYYLDASFIFDSKEEALYAASAADQLAIFDLGTFNDITTKQAIEALKADGTYSAEAHDEQRANQKELSRRFDEVGLQLSQAADHTLASAQQLLKDDTAALGLTDEQAGKVNPIYRPEVIPTERLESNQEAALWLEGQFEGEPITDHKTELTPEQIDEIATIMAAEAQLALESTGSALDWYSGALTRALDVVQVKYPMLADDAAAKKAGFGTAANARFAFTYIMAVTSQNLDVAANTVATDKAFEQMVKRVKKGVHSMDRAWGTGDKQEAMGDNFDKFGPMIEAMPGDNFPDKLMALDALFRQKKTVGQWVQDMKAAGVPYNSPGQTAMDAIVYGSSALGPKIGNGFWQNLNGNFDPLTIDLWMRRTWGRYVGASIGNPGALPGQRKRMRDAIKRSRSKQHGDPDHIAEAKMHVEMLQWYLAKVQKTPVSEFGTKKVQNAEVSRLKAQVKAAQEVVPDLENIKAPEPYKAAYNKDDAALVAYSKRILSVWEKEYARLSEKHNGKVASNLVPTWARAAKTVITNLAKPLDQVANGTQRKQIEAAGALALEKLSERGIDVTTADLQALLWYPEKDLWGALTTELETDADNNAIIPPSPLNESYDTTFARILREQGHEVEVEGVEGDQTGRADGGAVAGPDAQSQRPEDAGGAGQVSGASTQGTASLDQSAPAQTDSPTFKNWFKEGAVVEADGSPRPVFHSTFTEFTAFRVDDNQLGIHMGTQEAAENRTDVKRREEDMFGSGRENLGEPIIMEVYTNIQNPLRIDEDRTGGWRNADFVIKMRNGIQQMFDAPPPPAELNLTEEEEGFFLEEDFIFEGKTYNYGEMDDGKELGDFLHKWLGSKGFDGIVYKNEFEGGGDSYIAFKPTQLKSVDNRGTFDPGDPNIFKQTGQGKARGSFTPASQITDQNGQPMNLLQVFEQGDRSTFLHESGHFWLEQLKSDADRFGEDFQKDWGTVKKWWGQNADSIRAEAIDRAKRAGDKEFAAEIAAMSDAAIKKYINSGELTGTGATRYLSVAMHEQFARGTENYFKTGNAPSIALADAFVAFAVWIRSVYRSIQRLTGRDGFDVQFSPEVTALMDRMIATDIEIEIAASQYELASMFDTAAEAGMTQKKFAEHNEEQQQHKEKAKIQHLAKRVKEMERERLDLWKEEREEMRGEVEHDVARLPAYRLLWSLTEGGLADGSTATASEKVNRMDRDALKEVTDVTTLPKVAGKTIFQAPSKKNPGETTSPGMVANLYGYNDVQEMVDDLNATVGYAEAVEAEMTARMEVLHGSIDDGAVDVAIASIHEEDGVARHMAAELAALRTTEEAINPKFVKAYAENLINQQKMGEANPRAYLAAEKRHAKAAGRALKKGDRQEAYKHQFQRLTNYYLAAEADKQKAVTQKQLSYMRQFKSKRKKFPAIEAEYVDQIKAKVGIHDFAARVSDKRRNQIEQEAFAAFIAAKTEDGTATFDIPQWLQDKDRLVHWRDLTVGEFRDLHNTIKQLEKQGRNAKKVRLGDAEMDRNIVVARMLSALGGEGVAAAVREEGKEAGGKAGAAQVLAFADAALTKIEFLLEGIDGQPLGVWHQALYQPFADAETAKQDLTAEVANLIRERIDALPKHVKKNMGKRVDVGALAGTANNPKEVWTRANLIMLAMNVGNASNLDKVIRGEKSIGRQIDETIIDTALEQLTEEEWTFIRSIWAHSEKLWPTVEKIYRDEYGRAPERVEPREVHTQFGTFEGGYFPLIYNTKRSTKGKNIENMNSLEAFQSQQVRATVNSSMTKERVQEFTAPIDFDIQKLVSSFDRTIHFMTHYEAVKNANRILGHPELREAMMVKLGPSYVDSLTNWIGSIASNGQDAPATGIVDVTTSWLARNTTVAVLGASYSTLLAQILGYTTAIDRLMADTETYGTSLPMVVKDLGVAWGTVFSKEHRAAMYELSGEMRHRLSNTDRDLRAGLREVQGKKGVRARIAEYSMLTIAGMQLYTVDIPVWMASFNRSMRAEGDTDIAVKYADRVVRQSQSAGGLKDLAAIQRGKGAAKLVTMFYSFFSVMYAILRSIGHEVVLKNPTSIPRMLARLTIVLVLNELGYGLLRGEVPDLEPEDEDKDGALKWLAKKTVSGAAGVVPFGRDIVDGMISDYGYDLSPTSMFGEAVAESFELAANTLDFYFNSDTEEEPPELKDIKPLVLSLSILLKFPGIQANRTLSGLFANLEGEDEAGFLDLLVGYKEPED